MKRLILLAIVAILAFYVAWPAYSGLAIKQALEAKDATALSSKVDFPSVREGMRPAVTARVETLLDNAFAKLGNGAGALATGLKTKVAPKLVDGALDILVKPETLIRVHAQGARFKDAVETVLSDEVRGEVAGGALGGLLKGQGTEGGGGGILDKIGQAAGKLGFDPGKALGGATDATGTETPVADPAKPDSGKKIGLGNIKSVALNGPLGLALGVARDAAASEPDVSVELSFTGLDWKLTGLVPKL